MNPDSLKTGFWSHKEILEKRKIQARKELNKTVYGKNARWK